MSTYELLRSDLILSLKGDKIAYENFLVRLKDTIEAYLKRHYKNVNYIDDVTQDVLISVHLAKHTYNINKPFGPWIVAIIKRRLIDNFRKESRFKSEELKELSSSQSNIYDESILLKEILQMLPDKQREAIIDFEVRGTTSEDLAKKMNMTHSAVRTMLHRTMKHLQKIVTGGDYE